MPKTIEVEIQFEGRNSGSGTVAGKARVVTGGFAPGIGKAMREIFKNMDRKQRFDANKNGITVVADLTLDKAMLQDVLAKKF